MKRLWQRLVFGGIGQNAVTVDLGLAVLRIGAGLALCLLFQKFLPRDGVWGPPASFVEDVAKLGFPTPRIFAWTAVVSEFFGGILLVLGLLTRPAALLNAVTTGVAAFGYHQELGRDGAAAFGFFLITTTITLAGPGRFSLDGMFRWLQPRYPGRPPPP